VCVDVDVGITKRRSISVTWDSARDRLTGRCGILAALAPARPVSPRWRSGLSRDPVSSRLACSRHASYSSYEQVRHLSSVNPVPRLRTGPRRFDVIAFGPRSRVCECRADELPRDLAP